MCLSHGHLGHPGGILAHTDPSGLESFSTAPPAQGILLSLNLRYSVTSLVPSFTHPQQKGNCFSLFWDPTSLSGLGFLSWFQSREQSTSHVERASWWPLGFLNFISGHPASSSSQWCVSYLRAIKSALSFLPNLLTIPEFFCLPRSLDFWNPKARKRLCVYVHSDVTMPLSVKNHRQP